MLTVGHSVNFQCS